MTQRKEVKSSSVERSGIEYIPESDRSGRPRDLFTMFLSANVAQLYIVIGATTVAFGLNLLQAALIFVLANLLMFVMGWLATTGASAGVPASIIMRALFGARANRVLGAGIVLFLSMLVTAVNLVIGTFGAVELARYLGMPLGTSTTAIAFAIFAAIVIILTIYGYQLIVRVSGILTIGITIVFVLMAIYIFNEADPFSAASTREPAGLFAMVAALTLCVAMPLSWGGSADYSRRLPASTPKKSIILAVAIGGIIPLTFLELIGATAATIVDMSDPIAALTSVMPNAMGITFALAIVAGAIMNVVLTLYTASLGLQATGARVSRVQAVLVIGAITVALSVYVLFFSIGFLDALQFAMTLLASIATPLVAIYLTDAIPRRGRYNGEALSNTEIGGPVWYSGGIRYSGAIALVVGATLAILSLSTTTYVGPIASLFGGLDLSIPLGAISAVILFLLLRTRESTVRFPRSAEITLEGRE